MKYCLYTIFDLSLAGQELRLIRKLMKLNIEFGIYNKDDKSSIYVELREIAKFHVFYRYSTRYNLDIYYCRTEETIGDTFGQVKLPINDLKKYKIPFNKLENIAPEINIRYTRQDFGPLYITKRANNRYINHMYNLPYVISDFNDSLNNRLNLYNDFIKYNSVTII